MQGRPFGKHTKKHSLSIPESVRDLSPRFIGAVPTQKKQSSQIYSSKSVNIPFLIMIAAAIVGTALLSRHDTSRGCVNSQGVVVPDDRCDNIHSGTYPYRRHYGGSYRIGSYPSGGSYDAPKSSRGIFGGSGAHYGGGWS